MQDDFSINKRKTGSTYENRACEYLENNGFKVLERNFRCRTGEIDIIGLDNGTYVFVEVKYRKSTSFGHPTEAVTYKKQQTICRVANFYRLYKKLAETASFRFDIISILGSDITWYKNAFNYHI